MPVVRIIRQGGRRALAVDGIVQSIEVVDGEPTPGYWPEMLPASLGDRALMLGFGGGTLARLLLAASPSIQVLAVDDDEQVLALGRRNTKFRVDDERLTLEVGDAFAAVKRLHASREQFDYVAVDLYRGGEIVREALARPFLRRIGELLPADGTAAFNLMRDRRTARRIRRLGQHLAVRETRLVGLNCVVHCQRYPHGYADEMPDDEAED